MYKHIVQSEEWANIKTTYGTPAVRVGEVYYTKSKIPKINKYYAYCPRVNPLKIDFDAVKRSLEENNCIAINFDVPNVIKGVKEELQAKKLFENHCVKAVRSEFAKANVVMDITLSEKELFKNMHKKHRYNTRYALKKGVTVKLGESLTDLDEFYVLYRQTALREKYFIRPKKYFEIIWEELHKKDMCYILTAEYEGTALASWMLFVYESVLYYPYGGSSLENRNIFASNALGWEAIRFGKSKGCTTFDMWGAAQDPEDTNDPYHGFTNFKLKYGGTHLHYMDSYTMIINKFLYLVFKYANNLRWKLLDLGIIK